MKQFIIDLIERAVKTFAESLLAMISVDGIAFGDVDWLHSLSVAGMATLVSVLSSIASYKIGDEGTASVVKK